MLKSLIMLTAVAGLAGAAEAQAPWPEQSDYVCRVDQEGEPASELRVRVDLKVKAWCTSADACKEIKTIFGEKGDAVVLESSQLEDTSFETSIDRKSGRYATRTESSGLSSEAHGTCKPAPFTPFGVKLDGSKIKGG